MRWRALFALLALAAPSVAGTGEPPSGVATEFYKVVLSLQEGGIPDGRARARLNPLLSPGLQHALAAADRAELAYAHNSRHAVPPLLEGDIFVSLFDGATAAKVGSCARAAGQASCTVALSYQPARGPRLQWKDDVRLRRTPAGWRVDDIAYGGHVPFANHGTLKANLAFAIRNASGK